MALHEARRRTHGALAWAESRVAQVAPATLEGLDGAARGSVLCRGLRLSRRPPLGRFRACAGVAQLVEPLICNEVVGGSSPLASSKQKSCGEGLEIHSKGTLGRFPSGQREQTVNLSPLGFGGSNPPLPTTRLFEKPRRGANLTEGTQRTPAVCRKGARRAPIAGAPTVTGGNSSVGRASAFQAEGRGFEPRFPLHLRDRRKFRLAMNGPTRSPHSSVGRAFAW